MMKTSNVVWRLLRHNISAGQIIGYAVANLVGLAIVLTAVQFYRDFAAGGDGEKDSMLASDFLILSKRVSALHTLGAGSTSFSSKEIDDIASQPWCEKVGEFRSADFNVYASMELGGRGMSTYLFFEAIPDEFIDIKPAGWTFDPEKPVIPIVLSKDYLTLYNFGFAATRGLPKLSEGLISKVPLKMRLSGNGNTGVYEARIVGFSSRLNTIAVPEAVMNWADSIYSEPGEYAEGPSRIIVEVKNPGDPKATEYMSRHGYEIAGDKADSSRTAFILNLVTGIVITIGIIITLLAFFILTLSLYLLLQKNRGKLRDLILLGYTPAQVSRYYYALVACVNAAVLVLACAAAGCASAMWADAARAMRGAGASLWPMMMAGVAIMAVVTALNFLSIKRTVLRSVQPE